MITGNKGEWSELYVLLRLLADGKLYAANEKLERIEGVYSPVLRVLRAESPSFLNVYEVKDKTVELYINGDKIDSVSSKWLSNAARDIFEGILGGSKKGAFPIPKSQEIMDGLHITKIKANAAEKKDISLEMRDTRTGVDTICGFSVKSELGMPPTLLNASRHTNFVYGVDMTDDEMHDVNSIDTKQKIKDRMAFIQTHGGLSFEKMESEKFEGNVQHIDSLMDDILGEIVRLSYTEDILDCSELITRTEKNNPLGYKRKGLYRYKFKKFLCSVALGMVPGSEWDGLDEANGGYIVVKHSGDVVAYHLYNRDSFETYLLNNTRFERASTGRCQYAFVYEEDGRKHIRLNMQIRFV